MEEYHLDMELELLSHQGISVDSHKDTILKRKTTITWTQQLQLARPLWLLELSALLILQKVWKRNFRNGEKVEQKRKIGQIKHVVHMELSDTFLVYLQRMRNLNKTMRSTKKLVNLSLMRKKHTWVQKAVKNLQVSKTLLAWELTS